MDPLQLTSRGRKVVVNADAIATISRVVACGDGELPELSCLEFIGGGKVIVEESVDDILAAVEQP